MDDDGGGGDSAMCCPLGDSGDYEGPSYFRETTPKAKKTHKCSECQQPIPVGVRYENAFGIWDGRSDTYKTCLPCAELRDHFRCGNGFLYGELWSQLQENFFPEMKCGGQCMSGLSPEAKRKLIDQRMEWYFDQDEIDDSMWEDWAKRRPV